MEAGYERRDPQGSVTLYLALCLPLILSLFGVFFCRAALAAASLRAELAFDLSMDACLSEYHRELLEMYDLFFIDTSYRTAYGAPAQTGDRLLYYLDRNFSDGDLLGRTRHFYSLEAESADILSWRCATDDRARAVREQIGAYMSADPVGSALEEWTELIRSYEGIGLDLGAYTERVEALAGQFAAEGEEGEAAPEADDLVGRLQTFLSAPVLSLVYDGEVSGKSADRSLLASHRDLLRGDPDAFASPGETKEAAVPMLDLYLFEKCGYFGSPKKDAALDYQLEYILCGRESDRKNLEAAAKRIVLLRLSANLAFLLTNGPRQALVTEAAAVAAGISVSPHLIPLWRMAVNLAWCLAESLADVRTLLRGGCVPLVKTDESWQTDLDAMWALARGEGLPEGRDVRGGLQYAAYLEILLFLQNADAKTMRFVDVAEMEIRRTKGNECFRMDACVDCFRARAEVKFGSRVFTLEGAASYN